MTNLKSPPLLVMELFLHRLLLDFGGDVGCGVASRRGWERFRVVWARVLKEFRWLLLGYGVKHLVVMAKGYW